MKMVAILQTAFDRVWISGSLSRRLREGKIIFPKERKAALRSYLLWEETFLTVNRYTVIGRIVWLDERITESGARFCCCIKRELDGSNLT